MLMWNQTEVFDVSVSSPVGRLYRNQDFAPIDVQFRCNLNSLFAVKKMTNQTGIGFARTPTKLDQLSIFHRIRLNRCSELFDV